MYRSKEKLLLVVEGGGCWGEGRGDIVHVREVLVGGGWRANNSKTIHLRVCYIGSSYTTVIQ